MINLEFIKKNTLFLLIGVFIPSVLLLTSCESDTIKGDPDYFTSGQLTATLSNGSTMYFYKKTDGTVMVTYDRSNPLHLDPTSNSAVLTTYTASITVPDTISVNGNKYAVTAIDEMAFAHNTTLTAVTIPKTITDIGEGAFVRCIKMTTVNIPSGVTMIPDACFGYCSALKTLVIPASVTRLGAMSFANCTALTTLTLNEGLIEIADRAFVRCTGIAEIILPSTVTKIGSNAFLTNSKLTKIRVRATVPPALEDSLGDYISGATLYVPKGTSSVYSANSYWSKFKTIVEE